MRIKAPTSSAPLDDGAYLGVVERTSVKTSRERDLPYVEVQCKLEASAGSAFALSYLYLTERAIHRSLSQLRVLGFEPPLDEGHLDFGELAGGERSPIVGVRAWMLVKTDPTYGTQIVEFLPIEPTDLQQQAKGGA